MIDIPLQPVANQSFSVLLDGARYVLTFKEANGVMCADVVRDEVTLITGVRVTAMTPLLPYDYMQRGNFVLLTENDDLPYYTQFGLTQSLVYVSDAEIAALQ